MSVLAFYIERTKLFWELTQLFVAIAELIKGLPVLSQKISSCITACIRACYDLAKIPAPMLTAHFARAQASSAAFLAQVAIHDIWRADTWVSIHTFTSHYAIMQQARDDAAFGRAVLQSVTH
ncbi:hypothetical protein KIL84_015907 [Mauremys mutica]|uniref:Uncharacterized protein n=1 Tax=Mauremys mutica TaxID=74926 RepID=A0A9D3WTZ6_9SAUR|nr:hypothetical protein KIL84_015907 [Mauremys mutica]